MNLNILFNDLFLRISRTPGQMKHSIFLHKLR